jgi:3-oxoacyl-[acyl-carrier-protein] synthase II
MTEHRRVVATGIGCVTPIGDGAAGLWNGLREERSAVAPITRFDASAYRTQIAAEIPNFQPDIVLGAKRARQIDRYSALALSASAMAIDDAALDPSEPDSDRVAVQFGSALGGVGFAEEQHGKFMAGGLRGINPRLALSVYGGAASCNIAIDYGFTGPNSTNAMSCASGALAVGNGFQLIRSGEVDVAVCGSSEAPIAPLSFGAFAVIRAMSTHNSQPEIACRPFDEGRDGFVMGEAACVLVLEELERARRRGARIYGEVCGFGTTTDAYHMTAPRPDGVQSARAMRLALEDARVSTSVVDYINAHGSSTPLNDSTEAGAIEAVFDGRASEVRVSGTKAYYGHALGASGAIEAAIVLLGLENDWLPPSLNLASPGEGCDLRFVPGGGESFQAEHALTNSFGFGGINASLVLRRYDA